MKDWTGNSNSIYKVLGASNHTENERESNDYYATSPIAIDMLLRKFQIPHYVYEPACGEGHLSKRLEELGHTVYSSDVCNRGYGDVMDFLSVDRVPSCLGNDFCILTNPPYKYASDFVTKALSLANDGQYVIMFLKTTFAEGKSRYEKIFTVTPPKYVYQFVSRVLCAKNGDFERMIKGGGSAVSYSWWIWQKGYKGSTILDWLN